jgi:hypothetical protein
MTPDSVITTLNGHLLPAFRAASGATTGEASPVFAVLAKSVEAAFEVADNRRRRGRPDEAFEHLIAELPRAVDDFGRELDARAVTDKTARAACAGRGAGAPESSDAAGHDWPRGGAGADGRPSGEEDGTNPRRNLPRRPHGKPGPGGPVYAAGTGYERYFFRNKNAAPPSLRS